MNAIKIYQIHNKFDQPASNTDTLNNYPHDSTPIYEATQKSRQENKPLINGKEFYPKND